MTTFASGEMLTAAQLNSLQLLFRGRISGLVPSNGADATNDIDISPGIARDEDNGSNIIAAGSMTKQMDAAWAVGTAAGGRASGSIAWGAGSWHVFLIGKSTDETAYDYIIDDDATGANVAADVGAGGWDIQRRVFSMHTAGAAWRLFLSSETAGGGLRIKYKTPVQDLNGYSASTTRKTLVCSVPLGVQVLAELHAHILITAINLEAL